MKTVYENNFLCIELNDSDEVFVSLKLSEQTKKNPKCRITPNCKDLTITAANCRLEPWAINGLPAVKIFNDKLNH